MRTLLWILLLLVLAAAGYIAYLAWDAGEFRSVENQHPGECRQIAGLPGSEDITIHPDGTHAYISSDDRRSVMAGSPVPGAIFRYDLTAEDAGPVNLTPEADIGFRPHGIYLYVGDDGRETLFVISHPGESLFGAPLPDGPAHTIEIFDVVDEGLSHRETVTGDLLISPNDIVAVDHNRFYFTNDHGTQADSWKRPIEDYLRMPWSNVVFYDGATLHVAAEGLTYANGINLSPDGTRLYVAEVTRGRVQEFARDPSSHALQYRRRMDIGFGVDNIEIDPDSGDLWIGGHVKLLTFIRHIDDPSIPAPSQVDRVRVSDDGYEIDTVFLDDGHLISGASVGAWHDGRLLIGSVFDPHIVDCRGVR